MSKASRFNFRVWDGVAFHLWDTQHPGSYNQGEHIEMRSYPSHYVLQQSTGLVDKNGREIFEGDIVTVRSDREFDNSHDEIVAWSDYQPGFAPMVELDYEAFSFTYEIVGNIYENFEMVKK